MTAKDDYPKALSGFYIEASQDVRAMRDEIDQLRGLRTQANLLLAQYRASEERKLTTLIEYEQTICKLQCALTDQMSKAKRYKRKSKELSVRLERERQEADKRCSDRILKAGLKQGRAEEVDRKGEPITAREIMDKRATERKVNYDGSRVTDLHCCPWEQRATCDGLCY